MSNAILRTGASPLIPEEVTREIFTSTVEQSTCLSLMRRLQDMSRKQLRLPVASLLPEASFVNPGGNSDTGLKQTTAMEWANKYINAEEIACIVPIPEAILDDSSYNIWDEVKPAIGEAFGKAIDAAILFGVGAPSNWPSDIVTAATAAGNDKTVGVIDLYEDLMSDGGVIGLLEEDGFIPTAHIAAISMRAKLRGVRDGDGQPIFRAGMTAGTEYTLDGSPIMFPTNGGFDPDTALLISAQWNKFVFSIRQDMTMKLATEGVIQDNSGNIMYNLYQQDMVAMRFVMRLGWECPNPVNRIQSTEADRYPAAVLLP